MGPLNSGDGEAGTQVGLADEQLEEEGDPPELPTTPLLTELMETSDPLDKRAMFFPLLV